MTIKRSVNFQCDRCGDQQERLLGHGEGNENTIAMPAAWQRFHGPRGRDVLLCRECINAFFIWLEERK